jgi:NHL repeat
MADNIIEDGGFRYESLQDWAKFPDEEGWDLIEASGVAVDSNDNVYVMNRGKHPIIVFDRDGNFLRSWGEGEFDSRAHGICASPDDFIWTVNDNQHCVKKYTLDGKLVLTIGKQHEPAEKWSGNPFNTPTNVAVSPVSGDVYITDGYGNSRVHRYAPDGRHIVSWGEAGVGPGQFQIPHNVVVDADEAVFVNDRENSRVQVFDQNGNLQEIWPYLYRPQALAMDRNGLIYVGEQIQIQELFDHPALGHRLNVLSHDGKLLAHLGALERGDGPTEFIAPHGMAADSQGNLYVGEVSFVNLGRRFNPPVYYKVFRRLTRLG